MTDKCAVFDRIWLVNNPFQTERFLLSFGICESSTVCHASRSEFHPTSTPDLPLLEATAGQQSTIDMQMHNTALLLSAEVYPQWIPRLFVICRGDTDKWAHFSFSFFPRSPGPVCPEHALFTGGVPGAHLETCPADSWAGPLWTLRFEWRSSWIQSSVQVVWDTRLFSHRPLLSVFHSFSSFSYSLAASTANIVHLH